MSNEREYRILSPIGLDGGEVVKEGTVTLPEKVAKRLLAMSEPPIAEIESHNTLDADTGTGANSSATDGAGSPGEEPLTVEHIVDAIGQLEPGNEDHWTKGNKPDAKVLGAILKHDVSAAERDEAWKLFQERQAPVTGNE